MNMIISIVIIIISIFFATMIILAAHFEEKTIKAEREKNRFFNDKDLSFLIRIKNDEWFTREEDKEKIYDLSRRCLVGDIRYDSKERRLRASVLPQTTDMIKMDFQSRGVIKTWKWFTKFRRERKEALQLT